MWLDAVVNYMWALGIRMHLAAAFLSLVKFNLQSIVLGLSVWTRAITSAANADIFHLFYNLKASIRRGILKIVKLAFMQERF